MLDGPRRRSRAARGLFGGAVVAAAALTLCACGTPTPATVTLHVDGTPATSISVPLTNLGCTRNDVCVATGSTSASVSPNVVAEFGTPHGHWFALTVPTTSAPALSATACLGTQCLVGGSSAGGDLLWLFDASGDALTSLTPPAGGAGITALSCALNDCALLDTAASTAPAADVTPRLSFSGDAGTSWSTPTPLAWARGQAVTGLECLSDVECLVATTTGSMPSLELTTDGGLTWTTRSLPSSWTALSSLACHGRDCVALAREGATSFLARSKDLGAKWRVTSLALNAHALACEGTRACVVVGDTSGGRSALASVRGDVVSDASLRYVPTPLTAVACGTKLCAALGVTTLLSVPLAP